MIKLHKIVDPIAFESFFIAVSYFTDIRITKNDSLKNPNHSSKPELLGFNRNLHNL